jgi:hypothetical protein
MRASVAVFAWVLAGLSAAPAFGADVSFSGGVDAEGNATLAVNASKYEDPARLGVSRCLPGAATCEPVTLTSPVELALGDVAPGTVFEASVTQDGAVLGSARTPAWLGRVTNTAKPGLTGTPKTGATVRRTDGMWSGGWDAPWGSRSDHAIAACTDVSATDCFLLAYSAPVKIASRWAGWYLFAGETRSSASTYPIASRAATPFHVAGLMQGARSAPLGPVDGASTPHEQIRVSGDPYVSIRPRATRHGDQLSIGRVSCARCDVAFTVAGTRHA